MSLVLVATVLGVSTAKIFEKCELASLLEKVYGVSREDVKKWVCIAQYESSFDTSSVNDFNTNGSKDYGLFQLNNKYWCDDTYGKNVCRMPCADLLDDDLTDDVACFKKIIKETEQWKGQGTGYTAWVAYTNRCQKVDLDEYMSECWSSSFSSNNINIRDVAANGQSNTENDYYDDSEGDYPIINNARVPIRFNHLPFFRPFYQHVRPTPGVVVPYYRRYFY